MSGGWVCGSHQMLDKNDLSTYKHEPNIGKKLGRVGAFCIVVIQD